jgi:hypothetical protein
MRILYFLEDRAQEGFIKALVNRVAQDESIPLNSLNHDVRSARGGSRAITEFGRFMRDTMQTSSSDVDLLIVAIDGNCKGYRDRVRQLEQYIRQNHPLRNKVVYAVPDPHIERWYMMDQRAFKNGVGVDRSPDMPPYKCKKDYYKQLLRKTLVESNVGSLLGGAEYAENIVSSITSLDSLRSQNAGFQNFVDGLRAFFRARAMSCGNSHK